MNKNIKAQLGKLEVFNDAIHRMESRFTFSDIEFTSIRQGYARRPSMDYRWYIETENNVVYILRSWNPTIVFKIPFVKIGDKYTSDYSLSAFNPEGKSMEETIRKQNHWNFWIYSLITQLIFNEPVLLTLDHLTQKIQIDLNSEHGFSHWRAVYRRGKTLSKDADTKVLFYFSVFHSFFSGHDYNNLELRNKITGLVETLYLYEKVTCKDVGKLKMQMKLLKFAMRHCNLSLEQYLKIDNPIKENKTVRICLDSDKLEHGVGEKFTDNLNPPQNTSVTHSISGSPKVTFTRKRIQVTKDLIGYTGQQKNNEHPFLLKHTKKYGNFYTKRLKNWITAQLCPWFDDQALY